MNETVAPCTDQPEKQAEKACIASDMEKRRAAIMENNRVFLNKITGHLQGAHAITIFK